MRRSGPEIRSRPHRPPSASWGRYDAEAHLVKENGEYLAAELSVGSGERGLAQTVLADCTAMHVHDVGNIINNHEVDFVVKLRRQGQETRQRTFSCGFASLREPASGQEAIIFTG